MPPKAKMAAPLPLAGCSIALSGTFTGYTQSTLERDLINPLGATLSKSATASTTYLIATETDYAKLSTKVKQAKSNDVPIISLAWLEDCLSNNAKLDEGSYRLDAANGSANGLLKRSASADVQPPPKKAKTAASKTAAPSQSSQSGTADGDASQSKIAKLITKKIKEEAVPACDGETNIAKSKDIQIPVDEHCGLAHYRVYVDARDLIYDASLNQTNSGANNNKFYRMQVMHS